MWGPVMEASLPAVVEQAIAHKVLTNLHQGWLVGYDKALKSWGNVEASVRGDVEEIFDKLRQAIATKVPLDVVPSETLRVQIWNVAGRQGRDSHAFLARALRADVVDVEKMDWKTRDKIPRESPVRAIDELLLGLRAPHWRGSREAWLQVLPHLRAMVARSVHAEDPPPREIADPESFAWLDRWAWPIKPDNEALLRGFKDVSSSVVNETACMLVDQYVQWQRAGVLDRCGLTIHGLVPNLLANLSCYSSVLDVAILRKAEDAGIKHPRGIFRRPRPESTECTPFEDGVNPYYTEGFVLTKCDKDAEPSGPVIAGRGDSIAGSVPVALITLLDIDLTDRRMAFLGLSGTRLRVCDWEDHIGKLCVTRVSLDGDVAVHGKPPTKAIDDGPEEGVRPLQLGRPLVFPYEGHREAGYVGTDSRLGGLPYWEQYSEWQFSPIDGKPMMFLAQFPHPNGGTAYAFLDRENLVATVITQWD